MITQPPVTAFGSYLGNPGATTRYFWVQAVYPSGRSVLSNLVTITNTNPLSEFNWIGLSWTPAPGAISYDVIETSSSSEPTINSTASIGLVIGTTSTQVVLKGAITLVSWTYEAGNGSTNVSGTIDSPQIAFATGVDTLAGDANLTWDATNGLAVGKPVVGTGNITGNNILAALSVFFSGNSAPADGSLSAGQVALWFDKTNAAAKLMIKGKSADGTVVTGSVTLT